MLADTAELPTLADIQLAHLKLWALCLHGERGTGTLGFPRAHSGVLGCGGGHPKAPHPALTPPSFCPHGAGAAPEEKWLSALEATRWLDHVR